MSDTSDKSQKDTPRLSRWLLAGLAFLLLPAATFAFYKAGLAVIANGHGADFRCRLDYAITYHSCIPLIFCLECVACLVAASICFPVALHQINKPGISRRGKALALAGLWIAGGLCLFLLACVLVLPYTNGPPSPRIKTLMRASSLSLAIRQYENTYSVPVAPDGPVRDYDRLIAALTGKSPENHHEIPFLTPTRINPKTGRPEYKDPWGNDFIVVLSSSGVIPAGTGGIYQTVNASVAVWSKGPNQIDDHGGGDDIASWK